ncbi:MAG: transglutaminase-like domain-containing protein, partial [Thermoplasmatota archaeon]
MRWIVFCLLTVSLSGCLGDFWDQLNAPNASVAISQLDDGWNRDNRFKVIVDYEEPLGIEIVLESVIERRYESPATEATLVDDLEGVYRNEFEIEIPDGEWKLTYYVGGYKWGSFDVLVDTVAPAATGLELLGSAQNGAYQIGVGATFTGTLQVRDQSTGAIIGTSFPIQLSGLTSGIHGYDVVLTDQAGNQRTYTVQVRAGDAKFLPQEGAHDFGIISRYTTQLQLWDLTDMSQYGPRPGTNTAYMGSGFGIEPDHPDIQAIADAVVEPNMNSLEAAWALYEWMFDNLEYTEDRLDSDDLLTAHETVQNGGGVCRDLAALYVSLLRASDVPARLVTGYLAGDVNGFHAWVEVYAPSPNQPDWVPVDVSPIDGSFEVTRALGSFGISRPDYLPLSTISSEVEGWSTAISAEYTYTGAPPVLAFGKDLDIGFQVERRLCINEETLAR